MKLTLPKINETWGGLSFASKLFTHTIKNITVRELIYKNTGILYLQDVYYCMNREGFRKLI